MSHTQAAERCPKCGAEFICDAKVGKSTCWCFNLPNVIPVPQLSTETPPRCWCPHCLQEQIAAKSVPR